MRLLTVWLKQGFPMKQRRYVSTMMKVHSQQPHYKYHIYMTFETKHHWVLRYHLKRVHQCFREFVEMSLSFVPLQSCTTEPSHLDGCDSPAFLEEQGCFESMDKCPLSNRSFFHCLPLVFSSHEVLTQRFQCDLIIAFTTYVAVTRHIWHDGWQ